MAATGEVGGRRLALRINTIDIISSESCPPPPVACRTAGLTVGDISSGVHRRHLAYANQVLDEGFQHSRPKHDGDLRQ